MIDDKVVDDDDDDDDDKDDDDDDDNDNDCDDGMNDGVILSSYELILGYSPWNHTEAEIEAAEPHIQAWNYGIMIHWFIKPCLHTKVLWFALSGLDSLKYFFKD